MNKQVYFSVEEIKRKLERFCVYQERCYQEINKKMNDYQLIQEAKDSILLHLIEHNFVNEERYAKSYARGKFSIKKWGKQRIKRELIMREISSYNISTALKEIEESDYKATILLQAKKKYNLITETNSFKKRKKIVDYLISKGYEYDLIYLALEEVFNE